MSEESLAGVKKVMSRTDIDASRTAALHNFHNSTEFEYMQFLEECPVT
jgi:hypothetical protein